MLKGYKKLSMDNVIKIQKTFKANRKMCALRNNKLLIEWDEHINTYIQKKIDKNNSKNKILSDEEYNLMI